MTNTGNIDYKKIQDKQYLTVDTNEAQKIVSELNNQNIFYSARYDEAKISLTFSKADFDKVNDIINSTQPAPDEPVQSAADKALEEIQRQLLEMQENISPAKVADEVAVAPLPALPEHSIAEPEPIPDINSILPEIAVVMDMSISELENKPTDIKELLVLDYTNNFKSTPEEIQASLSAIIFPNSSVENNLEKSNQQKTEDIKPEKKENPLKSVEELIEGNANMIDGIINNLPPAEVKQEEHQENKVFTFSRKQLNDNAHKVKEQPSEQKNRDREPQNYGSL